ncbi:hypothetical protein ASPBRDRAFT_669940 [Aspergillus brasiliensis CBS 101740]|uniref:Oxidoreductase n=1 Tax=Aspergillus brasiliensis (strain CBS 101740 / IMI 381727 / IBT 21946) TaxID=767769 RepID=A0A1L9U1W9_ASPBC|nr:hypothetical protein ASPBRDRAFT_669940 [Aspergillus brasiliensis CBS 101740]
MSVKAFAIIAGVGPGTGRSVAKRFAKVYPVVLLARNPASLEDVAREINNEGGRAVGVSADLSGDKSMEAAFKQINSLFGSLPLAAAVFNLGGGFVKKSFLDLTEAEFEQGFNTHVKGGFNFAKATLPLLLNSTELSSPPTLIFTGATASLRGGPGLATFAAGKFALRALAQSLAREFGPRGVHVSHVIIDGMIDTPRTQQFLLDHEDAKLNPDAIAETYWNIHQQPRTALSFELELRPWVEKW